MNYLDAVAARLSRPDMLQATVLLFVALGFTLAVAWPTGISLINEAWFSLAPVRTSALAFAGLIYGAVLGARRRPRASATDTAALPAAAFGTPEWHHEAAATLGAVAVLAAVTSPFEVASHAASFPGTAVTWSLLAPFLASTGYFGIGLLLGRGADLARLTALLPLLVPAALAAGVWLDVSVGYTIVNPWSAALAFSPALGVVLGLTSMVSLWAVLPRRQPTIQAPADEVSG